MSLLQAIEIWTPMCKSLRKFISEDGISKTTRLVTNKGRITHNLNKSFGTEEVTLELENKILKKYFKEGECYDPVIQRLRQNGTNYDTIYDGIMPVSEGRMTEQTNAVYNDTLHKILELIA